MAGYKHVEIGCHGVLGCGYHIYLVGYESRDVLRNRENEGVVGHEAGVEDSLLVVEPYLVYASEVVAHEAELGLHICLRKERVCRVDVNRAYVVEHRHAVGESECIRLVFAGSREAGGSQCKSCQICLYVFHA